MLRQYLHTNEINKPLKEGSMYRFGGFLGNTQIWAYIVSRTAWPGALGHEASLDRIQPIPAGQGIFSTLQQIRKPSVLG